MQKGIFMNTPDLPPVSVWKAALYFHVDLEASEYRADTFTETKFMHILFRNVIFLRTYIY